MKGTRSECLRLELEGLEIVRNYNRGYHSTASLFVKLALRLFLYGRYAKQISDAEDLGMSEADCQISYLNAIGVEIKTVQGG